MGKLFLVLPNTFSLRKLPVLCGAVVGLSCTNRSAAKFSEFSQSDEGFTY